jgi:ubiquinone biosynthesis protein COQ4
MNFLKKTWTGIRFGFDAVLIVWGFIKLALNPKDISPIFVTRSFKNHQSFKVALASLRSKPEVSALIDARYLSEKPFDLLQLSECAEGSLGRVFSEHMRKHELEVVFYPPMENSEDDDINYMIKRARQTHDIHHVVLDIPAVDIGEIQISAFYLAQNPIPVSALILGSAIFHAVLKQPQRLQEVFQAIVNGWQKGKANRDVLGVRWEEFWEVPIIEVRRSLETNHEMNHALNHGEILK